MQVRLLYVVRDLVVAIAVLGGAGYFVGAVLNTQDPTTVALVLLLVVFGTATLSRLSVAVGTSIVATVLLNYFFFPPIGTLSISDPQHWVALVAFVVTAVVASQLSSAAQQRAREAVESRREVTRLFDLSRDILLTTDSDDALPALSRHVARRFDLEAIAICVPGAAGWTIHQGGARSVTPAEGDLNLAFAHLKGGLEYDARSRTYGGVMRVPSGATAITLVPIRLGTRPVGLLATDSDMLAVGTLDAVGGVVAIAIERAVLLAERKAAEALQQRADLASALLASFSHDLRTPLTAVRIALANLQEQGLSESDRHAQAALARDELERLNRLFQDILDLARIDAAGIAAERQWVTPSDIVDAALANLGRLLDDRKLIVNADSEIAVQVDPRLTSSALAHLIENAAAYAPPELPIEIDGRVTGDGLQISVRDRGPGIPASELGRLFERFYRGSASRHQTAGSGMGLAISRGLLAAEGGRVWAKNADGGGARFTIAVPAVGRPVPMQEM
jgi:two-component system sensor histidine kinase KdpD